MKINSILIVLGAMAISLTACTPSVPQTPRLTVQISGGNLFDSLYIKVGYPRNLYKATVAAQSPNRFIFEIPDSIFKIYTGIDFKGYHTENDTVKLKNIMFSSSYDPYKITSNYALVFTEQPDMVLNLRYITNATQDAGEYEITTSDPEIDLALTAQCLAWSEATQKEFIAFLCDSIQAHPDSRALMAVYSQYCLKMHFELDDLIQVYHTFSEERKKSPLGVLASRYIESRNILAQKFENCSLPESKTGRMQPLLADTTKYHLIIFSTSWCGPCHAQIPLLKEIYQDLSDRLEIVYISADTPDKADAWRGIMEKEQIPWPSFLPGERVEEVKNRFCVTSYPTAFLLPPGGVLELIEVRDPAQKEKLYQLVKNK